MKPIKIAVRPSGIRFLYDDRLKLNVLGPVVVTRASNVEWDNFTGKWMVQFTDGTWLNADDHGRVFAGEREIGVTCSFTRREDALVAEVAAIHATL